MSSAGHQVPADGARSARSSAQVTGIPDGGLLLVDKPSGPTSHDVVGRVRRVLGTRRVGHAGTLDPLASGLLVLAVERSTKLLGQLALTTKSYTATIRLGRATLTDDSQGAAVPGGADAAAVTQSALDAGIAALTGTIDQVPSAVSAIKVDGRRAYDLVREGTAVQLAARPVTITRFARIGPPRPVADPSGGPLLDVDVEVDCSTGTYVRALARDLGSSLGVGGHLTRLRRTRVGPFGIDDAVDVYGPAGPAPRGTRVEVPEDLRERTVAAVIPAVDAALRVFDARDVDAAQAIDLSYGRALPATGAPGVHAAIHQGALLALLADQGDLARPLLVWSPAG